MQGVYGGMVRQTGPRRLEASYPHQFITVLMAFPVLTMGSGAVIMIIGAVADGSPALVVFGLMGAAAAGALGSLARRRWRGMGDFVLDVDDGVFERRRGGVTIDPYALEDVVRVTRRRDWLHRGFTAEYWLIVQTRDGRSYRVGKASASETERTLALLRSWGAPVQG